MLARWFLSGLHQWLARLNLARCSLLVVACWNLICTSIMELDIVSSSEVPGDLVFPRCLGLKLDGYADKNTPIFDFVDVMG